MSRFVELFEWIEGKDAGTEIGSYDSEGRPTSVGRLSSFDGYCAMGHFYSECENGQFQSPHRSNEEWNNLITVAHAYNNSEARTREDYLNLLSPLLPEEYKLKLPELETSTPSEPPELCKEFQESVH